MASKLLSSTMSERLRKHRTIAEQQRATRNVLDSTPNAESGRLKFEDLPEYRKVQVHKYASELVGIDNPFYRAHDAAAGAVAHVDSRVLSNFASYDYLGLNTHCEVHRHVAEAVRRYGISASASRLVAGERPLHAELETAIAENYGVDSAVCFVSGYLTNVSAIACLMGPQDLIVHDEYIHNSALVGAQLSGAHRRFFKHNDVDDLDRILESVTGTYRRVLVIAEGVYSMDGDIADLPGLLRVRNRHGFWLMIDEAHALGVLGKTGRGTFEHFDIDPTGVDIWMGTLSKTTSSCGGYIAGPSALVEILKADAGGFVYSVGLSPPLAAAALASLSILRREPERVQALHRNGRLFCALSQSVGLDVGTSAGYSVVPVLVGDSLRAVELSNRLLKSNINALPIIHPAVPERLARIRFFLTCEHTEEQIRTAVETTAYLLQQLVEEGMGASRIDIDKLQRFIASK